MATLRGIGSAVGEYIGDGQGESSTVEPQLTSADVDIDDAEPGLEQSQNDEEVSSDNANPLLIFFDCETTGLSIYNDHITDVAAKVVSSPVSLESPTFSSLVATSRRIPAPGTTIRIYMLQQYLFYIILSYQSHGDHHHHASG